MKKRIVSLMVLVFSMVIIITTVGGISVEAKAKTIDDYLSASFDVDNIPIVDSYREFTALKDNNDIKPAIQDKGTETLYKVKAKENGCLVISYNTTYYYLYDVTTKNTSVIKDKYANATEFIPIKKGDEFAFKSGGSELITFMGFIPENYIFHVDESVKKSNGTLSFIFGNVYENNTVLSVYAAKKNYTTVQVIKEDVMLPYYKPTTLYEYSSVADENGDAKLILPETGEYTLVFRIKMKDNTIALSTKVIDTDDFITPSLDKLEKPIAAINGTNLMVGFAEPSATVYISYNNTKYQGKCDEKGIYKIVLNENLEKGAKFKIWQKKGKLTSKKSSYRVTSE